MRGMAHWIGSAPSLLASIVVGLLVASGHAASGHAAPGHAARGHAASGRVADQAVATPPRPARTAPPPPAAAEVEAKIDRVFKDWTRPATPGCAVGVSVDGQPAFAKAYGMADLEHDVENTPDTIFEAGSVSKQFTAAAVLLLAREGKLSLDDPARKYLPELPDYGVPLTIRHMLTHTSGLRDWGSVEDIIGWPRGTRTYTHAHVLDIVGRQHDLNFTPGTRYSYSNTGYNLAAIIVARVSGMPFAEFTRTRLFEPLGMTHTAWRDDYTRIVKGRAIAYSPKKDGFHQDMPFENVHGNGGLLTTVGDLLTWNENFVSPKVGDAAFVALQQEAGRFSDGRPHGYAFGLMLGTYKGVREVSHSGATAGYRSDLLRYPDQHTSVAVLCNAGNGNAVAYAHDVADLYLAASLKPSTPSTTHTLTAAEAEVVEGLYRNTSTGTTLRILRAEAPAGGPSSTPASPASSASSVSSTSVSAAIALRMDRGPALTPKSASSFVIGQGNTFVLDGHGGARLTDSAGTVDLFERVTVAKPDAKALQALAGVYASADAEATFQVKADGGTLILERRPDSKLLLTPLYTDAFTHPDLGLVIFRRNDAGHPIALTVAQDRVWDLRFTRQP
jgi:CubicO group peptidase (beta-lactamase class C family)